MVKHSTVLLALVALVGSFGSAAQEGADSDAQWLPSLITETPQEGFALAVTMSRTGVRLTQPDVEVLKELRPEYAKDADSLTAVSHVIAVHFQTIAAANDYWRQGD